MTQLTRRRVALLAIPVMLVCGLIVLMVSGLLVVGIGPLHLNTSPAAVTTGPGPVTITTDHARYLSTDAIAVTVTNSRPGPIYTWGGNAYCSIVKLEVLRDGTWSPSSAAACGCPWTCGVTRCQTVRAPRLVTIAPGTSYTATIQHNQDVPFPDGVYRLTLLYATVPPSIGADQSVPPPEAVITAPFDIIAVLLPPPTCPYPAALQRRPPAL
jgi:hypothetical protein